MGAWGHEPFANDTALDWIGLVNDYISKRISSALTNYLTPRVTKDYRDGQYEMIAAIDLLLYMTNEQHGHPLSLRASSDAEKLLDLGRKCMEQLLEDPWIEEWGCDIGRPNDEISKQYCEMLRLCKEHRSRC
jgi:hypothetical protein